MIDWQQTDVVLLDMDGTLLDLNFDNRFWLQHVPARYADRRGIGLDDACKSLFAQMDQRRGTLDWYCTDYWSETLDLDIIALKADLAHLVRPRPGVPKFLNWLQRNGKRAWLTTNAHPDTIAFKLERVDLAPWMERVVSSHSFAAPKESPAFWQGLFTECGLDPARCLLIDDTASVLRAAREYGVGQLLSIRQPDLQRPARDEDEFPALDHFRDIMTG